MSRTLVLAHRKELIDQAADKIRSIVTDGRTVGIVRAERDEWDADIVVATVQTLRRRLHRYTQDWFDLIVIDEAHHAVARTYRNILDHFPAAQVLGVSATLIRSDAECLGDVWEEVVYQVDILDLIDAGYLCDVRGIRVVADGLDLSKVRQAGGDYRKGALDREMDEAGAWEITADAYVKHARDRIGVVFTPSVRSAYIVAEMLTDRGVTAEAIDGTTAQDEREAILARFATGETQVVTNCGVLTEGYDNPAISCVTIARPTKSKGLYVQMGGRGLRPHPDKTDCLILDIVGVSDDKELATLADLTGHDVTEVGDGESLVEARDREDSSVRDNTSGPYLGELTEHEINLFGESRVTWSLWNGDVRYVNVPAPDDAEWDGSVSVYIAPSATPGRYAAIARHRESGRELVVADAASLPGAMRQAEQKAFDLGGGLVARRWRDKPASDGQRFLARRYGVVLPPDATTRTASALIDAAKVAPEVDRDFTATPPRGWTGKAGA